MSLRKILLLGTLVASLCFLHVATTHAQFTTQPEQGGTGISTSTGSSAGDCLKVSSTIPFLYKLNPCVSGGSIGASTSTFNAFYINSSTIGGNASYTFNATSGLFTAPSGTFTGPLGALSVNKIVDVSNYPGGDLGAQWNNAYASSSNGSIFLIDDGSKTWTTPISMSTAGKYVYTICSPGATLNWTGTSTYAVTINPVSNHFFNFGFEGCYAQGPDRAGSSRFALLGGSNGAEGVSFTRMTIKGFGKAFVAGDNFWNARFDHDTVINNGQALLIPDGISNSMENVVIAGGSWSNDFSPAVNPYHLKCIEIDSNNYVDLYLIDVSQDLCQGAILSTSSLVSVTLIGGHLEDPGNATPAYQFWTVAASTVSTAKNILTLIGTHILQGASSSSTKPDSLFACNGLCIFRDVVNEVGGGVSANFAVGSGTIQYSGLAWNLFFNGASNVPNITSVFNGGPLATEGIESYSSGTVYQLNDSGYAFFTHTTTTLADAGGLNVSGNVTTTQIQSIDTSSLSKTNLFQNNLNFAYAGGKDFFAVKLLNSTDKSNLVRLSNKGSSSTLIMDNGSGSTTANFTNNTSSILNTFQIGTVPSALVLTTDASGTVAAYAGSSCAAGTAFTGFSATGTATCSSFGAGVVVTSTAVTTGYFPTWGTANGLTGTSSLYQTGTSIVIGSTTCSSVFCVDANNATDTINFDNGGGSTALAGFNGTGAQQFLLRTTVGNSLNLGTNNTTRLSIGGSSGNVNIGSSVSTNLFPFQVSSTIPSNSTSALVMFQNNLLSGGSTNGTVVGTNLNTFTGDFENFQINSSTMWKLGFNGIQTFGASSTVVTPSISGAIVSGGCDSATTTIDSTVTSSTAAFITTPQNSPGQTLGGVWFYSILTSPGLITTYVCSNVSVTPTATAYVVKILK